MAVSTEFTWAGFGLRLLGAFVLVFATFNPSGHSYFHWVMRELPQFSILKGFVGVTLLIGWVIYLRATKRSLGLIGVTLAFAFFGTLLWLVVDWGIIPADSVNAVTTLVLILVAVVLALGMSWSHVRRRLSGQADVDELDG